MPLNDTINKAQLKIFRMTKGGKLIVAKDKRITVKHIRDMEAAGIRVSPSPARLGETLLEVLKG